MDPMAETVVWMVSGLFMVVYLTLRRRRKSMSLIGRQS